MADNPVQLQDPAAVEISRPLYIVDETPGGFRDGSGILIQVHRMDGMPAFDRFGEKLRSDRENWLSLPDALRVLSDMLGRLPQHSSSPRVADDTTENLRRFNDEFGYDVVPDNRKVG